MRATSTVLAVALMIATSCSPSSKTIVDPAVAGFAAFENGQAEVKSVTRKRMQVRYDLMFVVDQFVEWLAASAAFYEMSGASEAQGEANAVIRDLLEKRKEFYLAGSDLPREDGLYSIGLWCEKVNENSVAAILEIQRFPE